MKQKGSCDRECYWNYLDGEVRKGPSNKMMFKLRLEGRKEAAHVKVCGKDEPAGDRCKGPEMRKSLE